MKPCEWCGTPFKPTSKKHKYCCFDCSCEVNAERSRLRYYGKTLSGANRPVSREKKFEYMPIVERREYMSDLDKWRDKK